MNEQSIFTAALEQDPRNRSAFLDQACGADAKLRQRLETLVNLHENAGSFLDAAVAKGQGATDAQVPLERPGTQIGPYKLLQQIGEGGFGVVFMAEQEYPVRRRVALKIIKPGMGTRQVIARFEAERQALALMDHPNIAKVFDAGTTNPSQSPPQSDGTGDEFEPLADPGQPYFVMELVKGVPITEYCDLQKLTAPERLKLFVDVCLAVQHAHHKGIIHRDLKPSNIMVTMHDDRPVPKIIDFGVAKAISHRLTEKTLFTAYGQMIGTPMYMSPEQAQLSGLDVDTRSDIYSLGVVLYELVTGATPFDEATLKRVGFDEMRRMIREEEPLRPSARVSTLKGDLLATMADQRKIDPQKFSQSLRGEVDWIVTKALEKDRNRRYESANSLAQDIQRYINDERVLACPPSAGYRIRKFMRRNRAALVTAAIVATALVLTVAALAVSTVLITAEQKTTKSALQAEIYAKGELQNTLDRERIDSYFHRITLAYRELTARVPNPRRAEELLEDCPQDQRGWEWYYLKRLWRVEPVIYRNKKNIDFNSVAFSSDGTFAAAACGDGAVKVWDLKSGQDFSLPGHDKKVLSVAFSPTDGHVLASASADKTVRVWNLTTRQEVLRCRGYEGPTRGAAYSVAFSADGRQLAAASEGATVRVWDASTGQLIHELPGHELRASCVAFSRDGRLLATGSWRGVLRLWDTKTGRCISVLGGHIHPVSAVAFSPDSHLVVAGNYDRLIDVWDATSGEHRRTLTGHTGMILGLAFNRDGRLASCSEDRTVRIWDGLSGREILQLTGHTHQCQCVAFSPDGRRLASAGRDATIRFWDAIPLAGNEDEESRTFHEHNHEIWAVAISPTGAQIAAGGLDPTLRMWDATTGDTTLTLLERIGVVFDLCFSPDGRYLASAGVDDVAVPPFVVKFRDTRTGEPVLTSIRRPREIFATRFSPDGDRVALALSDGTVELAEVRTGRAVGVVGKHDRDIQMRGLAFHPNGRRLASVGSDGTIQVWDLSPELETNTPHPVLTLPAPDDPFYSVAYSPDGQRLVTGNSDGALALWDADTGQEIRTARGPFGGEVWAVAFSPDGQWIASAGTDCTARIWDAASLEPMHAFRGHLGPIRCLAISRDGKMLVTGSADKTVKVWDTTRWSEVLDR